MAVLDSDPSVFSATCKSLPDDHSLHSAIAVLTLKISDVVVLSDEGGWLQGRFMVAAKHRSVVAEYLSVCLCKQLRDGVDVNQNLVLKRECEFNMNTFTWRLRCPSNFTGPIFVGITNCSTGMLMPKLADLWCWSSVHYWGHAAHKNQQTVRIEDQHGCVFQPEVSVPAPLHPSGFRRVIDPRHSDEGKTLSKPEREMLRCFLDRHSQSAQRMLSAHGELVLVGSAGSGKAEFAAVIAISAYPTAQIYEYESAIDKEDGLNVDFQLWATSLDLQEGQVAVVVFRFGNGEHDDVRGMFAHSVLQESQCKPGPYFPLSPATPCSSPMGSPNAAS